MKCANIIKIGVILHPLNMMDFQKRFYSFYFPYSMILWPIVKNINPYRLKQFFSTFPTHLVFSTNVFEYAEKRIQILAAMCPVFPEQLIRNREFGVNRIKDGLKLLSNKGAKVITLAGFTSIVSNGGKDVILNISSAVTSGNSLTAALTIEGIEKKVISKGLNLNELTLAVIGATGDIGSICSLYFAKKVKKIKLCSRNIGDEPEFQNIINEQSPNSVEFTSDVDKVVKDADIILLATSSFGFLLNIDKLKLNAFVCDVSMPPNVSKDELCNRPDVQIYSGGRARLDFFNLIKGRAWEELFNRNEVYGCLAEGIALALDNQYLNFSIGKRQITLEGLDRIKEMANRNGIKVAV